VLDVVVLIGPMGSGKTTFGKKLAKELELQFIDTDKRISKLHGPITGLFQKMGEPAFRHLETSALRIALGEGGIIATGGGVILSEINQKMLQGFHTVFLDTKAEHVIGKISVAKRPLLKDNPEKWQEIYDNRIDMYRAAADSTVFTGGRSVRAVMNELRKIVEDNE
jgi:shikimate kinase